MPYARRRRFAHRRFRRRAPRRITFRRRRMSRARPHARARNTGRTPYLGGRKGALTIGRSGFWIPDRTLQKLRFGTWISLAPTSGTAYTEYVFSGNSVYDPDDISSLNTSAYGFNIMRTLYTACRVHASRIKVTAINSDATSIWSIFLTARSGTSIIGGITGQDVEDGRSKTAMVGPSTGPAKATLRAYAHTRKIFQVSRAEYEATPNYDENPAASDPSYQWLWHVGAEKVGPSANGSQAVLFYVSLTYYVEWKGRTYPVA